MHFTLTVTAGDLMLCVAVVGAMMQRASQFAVIRDRVQVLWTDFLERNGQPHTGRARG